MSNKQLFVGEMPDYGGLKHLLCSHIKPTTA